MYPEVLLALMLLSQWIYLKHEDPAEFYKTQNTQDCEMPCYSRKTGMNIIVKEETTPCNCSETASQTTLWLPLPGRYCQPWAFQQQQGKLRC